MIGPRDHTKAMEKHVACIINYGYCYFAEINL